jgi:hypothetical protein
MGLLMRFQRLAAEALGHSKPSPVPKVRARRMEYLQYRDQLAQWETDVESICLAFEKASSFDRAEFKRRIERTAEEDERCRATGEPPDSD